MDIMKELQKIFSEIFDEEIALTSETTADDIEEWDSLTHMQLIVEIERRYRIRFTTTEIKKAVNVGEFIGIIQEKLK